MSGGAGQAGVSEAGATGAAAGSLLEGIELRPRGGGAGGAGGGTGRKGGVSRPFVPGWMKDNAAVRWVRRRPRAALAAAGVLVAGAGVLAYLQLRFEPPPDYATAPMDEILDYTLITDDFNRLPLDQRLELLRELVKRYSQMDGEESVLMAQFAAMIGDDLREQMMKNASLLAIDLWDRHAGDYQSVPPEERAEWMDKTVVSFLRTMESFNPDGPRNISDEQLLEDARKQAMRDVNAVRSGQLTGGQLGQMADFMRNGMGRFAAPQVQARAAQLMRDMTRHLRGEDIATGKPRPK